MKWFDNWLYCKVRDMWENKHNYEEAMNERDYKRSRALKMNTIGMGNAMV